MPRHGVLQLLLVVGASPSSAVVAKPAAAKWAQFLDGSLTAVFQLKRGTSELCEGESAKIEDQGMTLLYSMACSGELYELKVLLQQPVDPARATVRRVRAEAIVTLHKDDPGKWWSSLAKHPKQFKTLIQRDTTRGDLEPDEDELVDAAAKVRARRAAGGSGATQAAVDAAGSVSTPLSAKAEEEASAKAAKLEQEVQEALDEASAELQPDGKVTPQTVSRLKALRQAAPDKGRVALLLSYLLLKRNEKPKYVIPMLREAIRLEPDQAGSHQTLAQLLAKNLGDGAADMDRALEAAALYQKGSMLMPSDAETYYQLGRMLQITDGAVAGEGAKKGKKGKKAAAAAAPAPPAGSIAGRGDVAAWRTAIKLKPDMAEAMQMLSLRYARSAKKKTREAARKLATRALKLQPRLPISYVALGQALAGGSLEKLTESNRGKAVEAYRNALSLHNEDRRNGLTPPREAEAAYGIGMLLATKPKATTNDGEEAAAKPQPTEPAH